MKRVVPFPRRHRREEPPPALYPGRVRLALWLGGAAACWAILALVLA